MSTRHVLAALCVLVAACSEDCSSCGEGQTPDGPAADGPAAGEPIPPPVPFDPSKRQDPEAPVRDPNFKPIDAGAAAGTIEDREGGHFAHLESPDLPRFKALQDKLSTKPVVAAGLASGTSLQGALPTALGDFRATGDVTEGPQSAGKAPIIVRAREYIHGPQRMIVKVTDTGKAPHLRGDYTRRLTLRGDVAVGQMQPAILGDHVVLEAFFHRGRSSWVVGLVGGRYLVEIRARNVNDPKAASVAFGQLKLSGLGN